MEENFYKIYDRIRTMVHSRIITSEDRMILQRYKTQVDMRIQHVAREIEDKIYTGKGIYIDILK